MVSTTGAILLGFFAAIHAAKIPGSRQAVLQKRESEDYDPYPGASFSHESEGKIYVETIKSLSPPSPKYLPSPGPITPINVPSAPSIEGSPISVTFEAFEAPSKSSSSPLNSTSSSAPTSTSPASPSSSTSSSPSSTTSTVASTTKAVTTASTTTTTTTTTVASSTSAAAASPNRKRPSGGLGSFTYYGGSSAKATPAKSTPTSSDSSSSAPITTTTTTVTLPPAPTTSRAYLPPKTTFQQSQSISIEPAPSVNFQQAPAVNYQPAVKYQAAPSLNIQQALPNYAVEKPILKPVIRNNGYDYPSPKNARKPSKKEQKLADSKPEESEVGYRYEIGLPSIADSTGALASGGSPVAAAAGMGLSYMRQSSPFFSYHVMLD